ncbi:hypothetical protein [Helicobacter bilis]|uniref:hypothetical protein n=1 Tax=Helicobacter bilis TaxID=37372 RepID=UPI00248DE025|nr:hypothetical protein [Helicobacter bilis]
MENNQKQLHIDDEKMDYIIELFELSNTTLSKQEAVLQATKDTQQQLEEEIKALIQFLTNLKNNVINEQSNVTEKLKKEYDDILNKARNSSFPLLESYISDNVNKMIPENMKLKNLVDEARSISQIMYRNLESYDNAIRKHNKKTLWSMFAGGFIFSALISSIFFIYFVGDWFVNIKQDELSRVERAIESANDLQRFVISKKLDIQVGRVCGEHECIIVDEKNTLNVLLLTDKSGAIILK